MKKSALLLFSATSLYATTSMALSYVLVPFLQPDVGTHNADAKMCPICWNPPSTITPAEKTAACITCAKALVFSPVSTWVDPALVISTGLDLLATYDQQEKTVDAKDAINELEEALKGDGASGSGNSSASTDSSLSAEDLDVLAPEIVVEQLNKSGDFDAVREAVESYSFETTNATINGECKAKGDRTDRECATERQNTWTLLSVTLAESIADKLLAVSSNMNGRYSELVSHFNEQTSPMGLWGAMNSITVDAHRQVNDINGLYARALEVYAVATLNESGVKKYDRLTKTSEDEE